MSQPTDLVFNDFTSREKLSREELAEQFTKNASVYDKTWTQRKYKDHIYVCQGVADFFPKDRRSSIRVLDVAAGTGMLAEQLWRKGFRDIDGLDPSEGMKAEAAKKNIYKQYFLEYMDHQATPYLANGTYNCLVVAAGFNTGLLPCSSLLEMCRLVKKGGLICFCIPDDRLTDVADYTDRLVPLMTWLEKAGVWSLLEKTHYGDLYDGCVRGTVYRFVRKSEPCDPQTYLDKLGNVTNHNPALSSFD